MYLLIWKLYAWIIGKKINFKNVLFFPRMKMNIHKMCQYVNSMNF